MRWNEKREEKKKEREKEGKEGREKKEVEMDGEEEGGRNSHSISIIRVQVRGLEQTLTGSST